MNSLTSACDSGIDSSCESPLSGDSSYYLRGSASTRASPNTALGFSTEGVDNVQILDASVRKGRQKYSLSTAVRGREGNHQPIDEVFEHSYDMETCSFGQSEATDSLSERSDTETKKSCGWSQCNKQFGRQDDLYDHVIEDHIQSLMKSSKTSTTTVKIKNPGVISCRWNGCQMKIDRDDLKKKVAWLDAHFKARHSCGVRPFRCIIAGCSERFTTALNLEVHVRKMHVNFKKPKKPSAKKEKSMYGYAELANFANCNAAVVVWDDFRLQRVYQQNEFALKHDFKMSYMAVKREVNGSAKRKVTGSTIYKMIPTIVQLKEKEKRSAANVFDAEAESKTTMDMLFPGWNQQMKEEDGILNPDEKENISSSSSGKVAQCAYESTSLSRQPNELKTQFSSMRFTAGFSTDRLVRKRMFNGKDISTTQETNHSKRVLQSSSEPTAKRTRK